MGVVTFEYEVKSTVPPAKLFKALTKNDKTVLPEANEAIECVKIVEGNGEIGSIKELTIVRDGREDLVRHKIEAEDEANMKYAYSLVGATRFDKNLEKLTVEIKLVTGPKSHGSIAKITAKYYTRGDAVVSDAVRYETKAKADGLFQYTEEYVEEKC